MQSRGILVNRPVLSNLKIGLPLVIVDLIIEYQVHFEYCERVWSCYVTSFWFESMQMSVIYKWSSEFAKLFSNIRHSKLEIDTDEIERVVGRFGTVYEENRNEETGEEENSLTPFDVLREGFWNQGTFEEFEGKNWLYTKFVSLGSKRQRGIWYYKP